MKEEEYDEILSIIRSHKTAPFSAPRKLDDILKQKFPHVSDDALYSIYSFEFQRRTKRERYKHFKAIDTLYKMYIELLEKGSTSGILLQLANKYLISPSLLARHVLEKHYDNLAKKDEALGKPKRFLTQAMRDTTLIDDKHLAYEIFLCTLHDDQYGPIAECINYSVGQQYEQMLHQKVQDLNLPFYTEDQMRLKGYDKTPDIKLEVPFSVNGFIVNWIESKALFGDKENHTGYLKDQYLSYWNRFGTGLVIYWFGYIDTLDKHCDNKIIIRDSFPTNLVLMNPKLIVSAQIEALTQNEAICC